MADPTHVGISLEAFACIDRQPLAILCARCCGVHICVIGVSIKLGAMATTRIAGAKARAKDMVIA